jgi:hypothetical protein
VLRLRAEVERLKAVVAAATESRATAVKQSDEAVSLAAHDLLKVRASCVYALYVS